jgi:hypothetical protein
MTNKFLSFLEAAGRDFEHGLERVLPWAAGAGEVAVGIFAPTLSPIFNQTVAAVITAEQKAALIGKQAGSGAQKLADVVQLMGPLIAQALTIAGKAADAAAVASYVSAVVTILNAAPAPALAP